MGPGNPGRCSVKLLLLLLLLAWTLAWPAPPARGEAPGPAALCELQWTQPVPPSRFPEELRGILDLAAAGDFAAAARGWEDSLAAILGRGAEVLRGDGPGVEAAREFMDRHVRSRAPILEVRGDLLTPTLGLATWAAELHCRAGNRDATVRTLRAALRDYGREELRGALLVAHLRFGETERAAALAPGDPSGWREKAATGWLRCLTGDAPGGLGLLEQARSLAPDSRIRGAVEALREACMGVHFEMMHVQFGSDS